jgi:uncharacterized protein YbjQ (UPF0145 family)
MAEGEGRMCARTACERVGQPTSTRRCQSCGYVTESWDPERSERLRHPAVPSAPIKPTFRVGIPVSTSNDVPGWQITEYLGEVFGLVVRSRGAFPQLGANLKSVFGGELGTMTKLLRDTRQHAIARLVEEAETRGADAIIGMRFDVTSMGDTAGWTEVCAYGTAVAATKLATSQN